MKIHTVDVTNPDLDFTPEFIHKFCEVEPHLRLEYRETNIFIKSKNDAVRYLADTLADYPQERCYAIFLDVRLHPLGYTCVGSGSLFSCPVSFSKIAQTALLMNASGVILLHNHPSYSPAEPSKQDIKLAQHLSHLLHLLDGMVLYDFIIISGKGTYSMACDKTLSENPTQAEPMLSKNIAAQ